VTFWNRYEEEVTARKWMEKRVIMLLIKVSHRRRQKEVGWENKSEGT